MKTITLLCLLVGVFITKITTITAESSIESTADNFAQIVYEKPSLVKFYSPYCGHCQRLAPTWEAAAIAIHSQHPNIQLVALDCTKYGDICNKFAVRGYPTIKYIRPSESDAELAEYSQKTPDSAKALTRWVYAYENGARTVLAFEQFVSDASQWSKSPHVDFPLELPAHPEILNVLTREKRVSDAVEKAESINQPLVSQSVKSNEVTNSYALSSNQSNFLHDALWLVVGLLAVACAYWLYLTLKVNGKLSKFT